MQLADNGSTAGVLDTRGLNVTPREQLDELTLRARTEPVPFGGGQGRSAGDIRASGEWLALLLVVGALCGLAAIVVLAVEVLL